jgi:hypothetical protein
MITVKDHKVLKGLLEVTWHKKMMALALWCAFRYSQFCITSGWREGDPGVHGTIPCRGMDMRSTVFSEPGKIVDDINSHWEYDPTRPLKHCALLHNVGSGVHIHLQVGDSTIYHENGRTVVNEL